MCPCSPTDVNIPLPTGPSGPVISGFGNPFALKIPDITPFPEGFPEDLLDLLGKFQLLIPPGAIKPALNPNFGKDIFDAIMKLLDQFFPFLMLYKFFLPVLNLIICMIEVLCAIPNPFKLIRALKRLFRNCLPAFLNLFPIFALIIMIISLLILILALIEYIASQILKFAKAILRNIAALNNAFQEGNSQSVLAIAKKLGSLLCIFQNLFVILSLFNTIIQLIRDMLSLSFAIPPCDDGDPSDANRCCTPDVCPAIIKNGNYIRSTGTLQYLNLAAAVNQIPGLPAGYDLLTIPIRNESWQIYDNQQEQAQEFINIVDAYDVVGFNPKPSFFPSDAVYNSTTAPSQAAYTVDLRVLYNPINWGRTGATKFVKILNCIVTTAPSRNLSTFNNGIQTVNNGVMTLAGGLGYEDDGVTPIFGFAADGVTPIGSQATLENFLHKQPLYSTNPTLTPFDGYSYLQMEYTFKPNLETLLRKQLITLGCEPSLATDRVFLNNVIAGDIGLKTQLLGNLINNVGGAVDPNAPTFPDLDAAQQCMSAALSALRSNLTTEGVAQFQVLSALCLSKLKADTTSALSALIGIGFDACSSDYSLFPTTQFTTKPITVTVNLKEKTGLSLTTGIPADIAATLADKIKAYATFGEVSKFSYDGYQAFTSTITSDITGSGDLMISYDNNIFCINTTPTDIDVESTHTLQSLPYNFIFTPTGTGSVGDTETQPRRDAGDVARDSGDKGTS